MTRKNTPPLKCFMWCHEDDSVQLSFQVMLVLHKVHNDTDVFL